MNKRSRTQYWLEFLADFTCLITANILSFVIFRYVFHKIVDYSAIDWVTYAVILILSFLVTFIGFHKNININKRSRKEEFSALWKNITFTYMLFLVIIVLLKSPIVASRYMLISGYIVSLGFSMISRYFLKRWITGYFTKSKIASIAGIITTSDIAEDFISGIQTDWTVRISGVALLDNLYKGGILNGDTENEINGSALLKTKTKFPENICDVPVISTDESFMDWIRSAPLDEVFINLPYKSPDEIQEIVEELEDMGITVHLNIPTLDKIFDESKFNNINCKMYSGYPMATFSAVMHDSKWLVFKRIVDVVLGTIGCIASAFVIALVAIPLLIESPGPLIFKQQRVGKNGRLFKIYKLRSMYADAEKRKAELMENNKIDGLMFKIDDDPRITKVGKFIRKYSIDELPQFFNVVKGDMSIIGTRPPTIDEFEQYESRHKRRLSMRPGITGMWQVSGRSDIIDFEEVVKLDCEYIDNCSPALDLKIFFKTIGVVLTHKGAE